MMNRHAIKILLKKIKQAQQTGDHQVVLKHYHAALQRDPGSAYLHYQLGLYFLNTQAYDHAIKQFKNVLAIDDAVMRAYFNLGIAYFHTHSYDQAKAYFEKVTQADPDDVEAWVNLGAIAVAENQSQLAIEHFTRALRIDPGHEAARSNLAATFMHFNRHENALTHYLVLLETMPDNLEYQYAAALSEMTLGQFESARRRFGSLLTRQPDNFDVIYNLAVLNLRLNQKEEAKRYLSHALSLKPDDASCQHLLASLTGGLSTSQSGMEHAHRLFENYAVYYDQHMLTTLQYQLPYHIVALIKKQRITASNILDLGCGTGLCGELLQSVSPHLVGVDLSANMLDRAKEKHCYEQCIEQDVVSFLNQTHVKFDLIVAADLFPYLGELEACMAGLKRCLSPGGYAVFSVEISEVKPWQLQQTARYAHHADYIHALCEKIGLAIKVQEKCVARQQAGDSLAVWVFLIRAD